MSKIELQDVRSGYNLSRINQNFQEVKRVIDDEILFRDNPVAEPNSLETDIDMNGKRIYNLPTPILGSEPARFKDVKDALAGGNADLISFDPYKEIVGPSVQLAIEQTKDEKDSLSQEMAALYIDLSGKILDVSREYASITEPEFLHPYLVWADLSSMQLKRRNAANTNWIVESTLFKSSLPQYAAIDIPTTDKGPIYVIGVGPMEWNGSSYQILLQATATDIEYDNSTSGLTAIDVQTAIDELMEVKLDATTNINLGTTVTATGTIIDFTGIPSWAKRITIMYNNVSSSSSSPYILRLGDLSGIDSTSTYTNTLTSLDSSQGSAAVGGTSAFRLNSPGSTNSTNNGIVTLYLLDATTNRWILSSQLGDHIGVRFASATGSKALTSKLNSIRLSLADEVSQYDAGTINISWE